jgi:uridine kinase/Gpi18-like mannosyltransferase
MKNGLKTSQKEAFNNIHMKKIYKSYLVPIIIIKLILIFTFSSQYNSDLFYPFLTSISFENLNPWTLFYEKNLLDNFPYHGLMLLILAPFAFLGELLNVSGSLLKIPLLIADLGILFVLLNFFPNKEKKIFIYYFLNPVLIYATYIHSQLDIIPTAFLFFSIYFLSLKKIRYSALFFGLALATKFHVIIALPLIIFYVYKKFNLIKTIRYILLSLIVLVLFDLPFLFSDGFIQMVILNPKQSIIYDAFFSIGSVKLLLPVFAISMVYLHFFNQNKVNQDLLFFYFGLLFTVTIFFIYPGPAWYVWIIPYVSVYFIKNENQNKTLLLHFTFAFTYLLFIVFFYESEYTDILFLGESVDLKIRNENLRNLSFTILEVTIIALMYAFYKYGIKSNSIYKKQTNLSIGIGGDSAVGKSSLLNNLRDLLGDKVLQIEGDGEHKWERGNENWKKYTHLDPKANYMHKQADAIYSLKHNKAIFRKEYDHSTGKFTEALKVEPKEFIIIAGLHPFYLPKLRRNIDIKIYIDTDESLRRHWKILRDTKKRGYSIQNILSQIEIRMDDAKKYIYPQKNFADLVLNFFPINKIQPGKESKKVDLGLKIIFDASINIEIILEKLNCEFSWDYNDDLKSQFIELTIEPTDDFKRIAIDSIDNIYELVSENARWNRGYDGFIQLLNIKLISEKLKEDRN